MVGYDKRALVMHRYHKQMVRESVCVVCLCRGGGKVLSFYVYVATQSSHGVATISHGEQHGIQKETARGTWGKRRKRGIAQ